MKILRSLRNGRNDHVVDCFYFGNIYVLLLLLIDVFLLFVLLQTSESASVESVPISGVLEPQERGNRLNSADHHLRKPLLDDDVVGHVVNNHVILGGDAAGKNVSILKNQIRKALTVQNVNDSETKFVSDHQTITNSKKRFSI